MSLIKAIILFLVLGALGAVGVHFGWDPEESKVVSYPLFAPGMFCVVIAGGVFLIVIAKIGLILIDMILFPGEPGDPPPALYKLPEWYISEGRFGDALEEYEKISKAHPKEVECWTGMLDVLVTHMGNINAARKTAQTGLRKVRAQEKQEQLRQYYMGLTGETLKPSLWS
ncbi:MAG: hypothetical protein AAF571_00635 [Verrucomicrobiota bacterium]